MYFLNISLMTNRGAPVSLPWLRSALTLVRVAVKRSMVRCATGEPTFAAELRAPLDKASLDKLAEYLQQDCIAYYGDEGGVLAGSNPLSYFDTNRFLLPSGGYLGDVLAVLRGDLVKVEEHVAARYYAHKLASCGCFTPDGRPGNCDECAPVQPSSLDGPLCAEQFRANVENTFQKQARDYYSSLNWINWRVK